MELSKKNLVRKLNAIRRKLYCAKIMDDERAGEDTTQEDVDDVAHRIEYACLALHRIVDQLKGK